MYVGLCTCGALHKKACCIGTGLCEVRRVPLLRASVNRVCTRRHLRLRTLVGSGVAHSGILKNRKVRHSYAQTNSRGGQLSVLPGGSGRGCGPDTVVVDTLAGARTLAVLGAHASARGILLVAGLIALIWAFVRFVME